MKMVMPHNLVSCWFVVLSRRNSFAIIGSLHSSCHDLGRPVNIYRIFVWKNVEIFEVNIWYYHYMTLVVWPPLVCDERRDAATSVDDVALLGPATRFLDSGRDPAKRTVIPLRSMRSHRHRAPPPFLIADRLSGSR